MQELLVNPKTGDVITVSTTWLYYRKTIKGVHHYFPYSLDKQEMLKTLKLALLGEISALDSSVLKNTFIRFGWLDKNLKNLEWVCMKDVLKSHQDKTIKKSVKTKLDHVCRLLFISIKDIKHPSATVSPKEYIDETQYSKNETFALLS